MSLHHIQLSSWESSTKSLLVRKPQRPEALQQSTFEDEFDYTTLVYDLFTDLDGNMRMLCPPQDEFLQHLEKMEIRATESGEVLHYSINVVDRVSYLKFDKSVASIQGIHDYGRVTLTNQPNLSQLFAGRKVVFTMQKNNKLAWLADWALYYVKHHGADAFLIYDNASDQYDLTAVYEAINQVASGLEVIVVDWPFKYGPAPTEPGDFQAVWSQRAAMNHARIRFLGKVAGALNIDIDEYVWCADGGSVYAKLLNSGQNIMQISGFKGKMSVRNYDSSIRDVNRLGIRDRKKWVCNGDMTRHCYWQPHVVKSQDIETGELSIEEAVFELEEAVYFHLRGLRTIATNRKLRIPRKEIQASREKDRKPRRKGSMRRYIGVVWAKLRNFRQSKSKGPISTDMETEMDPDMKYPERPLIDPIFERFAQAVKELPQPREEFPETANALHKRIWAGELFRHRELNAARARVEELIRDDGKRTSYERFLSLIDKEKHSNSNR